MSQVKVLNQTLTQDGFTLSDEIYDAVAFYIVAPDLAFDVEIDVFLQIEISLLENRQIRLFDGITLTNTEVMLPIPLEYRFLSNKKYFAFYSDISFKLECYALYPDSCECQEKLESIESIVQFLEFANSAIAVNQVQQNLALAAFAGVLGGVLLPITGGTSAALPPAVAEPLLTGTSTLFLLPGLP